MEKFKIHSLLIVSVFLFVLGLIGPVVANAASPSLGLAASYGILCGTYTNTNPTTVNGDVGFTTGPGAIGDIAGHPSVTYPNYGPGAPYAQAQSTDAFNALNILNALSCPPANNLGAIVDLSLVHGATYTPGVYCSTGAMSIGAGGITLNGAGTYVFRANGELHIVTGSTVNLNGVCANDVFWTPTAATTFDANTNFSGTIIDNANAISVGANTTLTGRIISLGAGVATTDTDTITVPSCGGVSTPAVGSQAGAPPLISVVKVPNPLSLPTGPGPVTYNYTLNNIGVVPVTAVTMIDDTCSPLIFDSGDVNSNSFLDINETWKYHCSMTVSTTTTNTVIATGWANGMSAIDIAKATVVVSEAIVPPLIHVTKVPSPLLLFAGSGMVTYTNKVTNPGTVALSNVHLIDDKCGSPTYISGDINKDSKLDTNETWTYTCTANLTKTTTNTVIASGEANGMTAKDFAIATVVVTTLTSPALPNTGLSTDWTIGILAGLLVIVLITLIIVLRKRMM